MSAPGPLSAMITQLVALEDEIRSTVKAADPKLAMRGYTWRPPTLPQLPAIWNWIDDGSYEVDSTAEAVDDITITPTIAVKPGDMAKTMDQLIVLTDYALAVIDPALWRNQPLGGTVRRAKRVRIATRIDWFPVGERETPVMCMDLPIEVRLPKIIQP